MLNEVDIIEEGLVILKITIEIDEFYVEDDYMIVVRFFEVVGVERETDNLSVVEFNNVTWQIVSVFVV